MKISILKWLPITLAIISGTGCDNTTGPALASPHIILISPEERNFLGESPFKIPISARITSAAGIKEVACEVGGRILLPLTSQADSLYTWGPLTIERIGIFFYKIQITAEDVNGGTSSLTFNLRFETS